MTGRAAAVRTCTAASAVLVAVAALTSACTSSHPVAAPKTIVTGTQTVVTTQTVTPSAGPAPATVAPLSPGVPAPAGQVEGACPYIGTGLQLDPNANPNMADLEGDRIYRVTRLTTYNPVGCRFYFWAPPYEAIADIRPYTFNSATAAYNAMIAAAAAGTEEQTRTNFGPGLTGILFRTQYFGPAGARCWAFVFAKGNRMIGIYTQRTDLSLNAVNIAQAVAGRF